MPKESESSAVVLSGAKTEALPELKARSFQRLEASLAALTHIAANQAKLANWWSRKLVPAMSEVDRLEVDPEHPRYDSSLKRVKDIVEAQGKAFDRIMKAADQAVVVARTLGLDVGESAALPLGVKAEGVEDGKEVEVTGVPGTTKPYKFARSAGVEAEGEAEAEGEDEAAA